VAWAAAIARTCAIDRLRARPPGLTLSADTGQPDHMQPGDAALVQSLDARRLAAALALLDPRHAAAIRACYLDGVSHDVLAQRHGVPVQTVKNWVRRGLIRVRASLQRGA
jgi:RNA polymerase sigma-70 factor (ECF subfamily)